MRERRKISVKTRGMGWESGCWESTWNCGESGWKYENCGDSGWRCNESRWKLKYSGRNNIE